MGILPIGIGWIQPKVGICPIMATIRLAMYRFWSNLLGAEAIRFSTSDERGAEYYTIAPAPESGKSLRELRNNCAMKLYEAMEDGRQPGEVA